MNTIHEDKEYVYTHPTRKPTRKPSGEYVVFNGGVPDYDYYVENKKLEEFENLEFNDNKLYHKKNKLC